MQLFYSSFLEAVQKAFRPAHVDNNAIMGVPPSETTEHDEHDQSLSNMGRDNQILSSLQLIRDE